MKHLANAPRYDWVCAACETVNAAGEGVCAHCTLPSALSAADIARHRADDRDVARRARSLVADIASLWVALVPWSK